MEKHGPGIKFRSHIFGLVEYCKGYSGGVGEGGQFYMKEFSTVSSGLSRLSFLHGMYRNGMDDKVWIAGSIRFLQFLFTLFLSYD